MALGPRQGDVPTVEVKVVGKSRSSGVKKDMTESHANLAIYRVLLQD